jgi:hypothetical protein
MPILSGCALRIISSINIAIIVFGHKPSEIFFQRVFFASLEFSIAIPYTE